MCIRDRLSDVERAGTDAGFPALPKGADRLSGQPLYDALDDFLAQLPTSQVPDLNPLLRLSGSITLSDATCSQKVVHTPVNHPPPPDKNQAPPPGKQPPGAQPHEPPLADTGASAWGPRATYAGLTALGAGGALLMLVLRRRNIG